MNEVDFRKIEEKWQQRWEKERVFEAEPDSKGKKKFLTAAFPYPNSPQHIGHGRTYTTTDIYARYLRLKGYNVLFPMAFHVTGTPILAMAKRIAEKDEEIMSIFEEIYGISRETAAGLTDPKALVMYFSKEIEAGMREMGYAIDWRRKFYTFDAKFNRFIEWQFHKLKEQGYLVKGKHPVAWCKTEGNAVGAHDTKGDVDPVLEEVTAVKFGFADGSLVAATYRPETVYGVKNVWVNENVTYVKAKNVESGEILYLAKKAAENLMLQLPLEVLEERSGKEFLGKYVTTPLGESVPILPATFVKEEEGTGVVMSVPAHAPYDYLALRDSGKLEEIGLRKIIDIDGYNGLVPAKIVVERLGVKDQNDLLAEKATKELYRLEAASGVMSVGEFKGEKVSAAKEKVKARLKNDGKAFTLHIIANAPVYCRCGGLVTVNIVADQWFIDYSNQAWKEKARHCIQSMRTVPAKTREDYISAIDWLKEKACVRSSGLGTAFPFDRKYVIEALSDSTIYMAFYTFAHLLDDVAVEELTPAFFDYVLLGKGSTPSEKAEVLRKNFIYWYPLDSRHSGADLLRNHLPFFIMNHTAIFPKVLWPKQIVVNGFVLMEGRKMSKSMGNILPLRKAIREYGCDPIRVAIVGGAELNQDSDFNRAGAEGVRSRMTFLLSLLPHAAKNGNRRIDRWLLSRLHRRLKGLDEKYENFQLREVIQEMFYEMINDLSWYMKRTDEPGLREFFENWAVAFAPIAPHICEEVWERLGKKQYVKDSQLVVNASLPEAVDSKIDRKVEIGEEVVATVRRDVEKIATLLKKKAEKIFIYAASNRKRKIYDIVRKEKRLDVCMKAAAADEELKKNMSEAQRVIKQLSKDAYSLPEIVSMEEELEALLDAKAFFEKEFSAVVFILSENEAQKEHTRAGNALPGKPAIVLE